MKSLLALIAVCLIGCGGGGGYYYAPPLQSYIGSGYNEVILPRQSLMLDPYPTQGTMLDPYNIQIQQPSYFNRVREAYGIGGQ